MDSTSPIPVGPGQRLLAAIVFTDTVSFSARMQAAEVATLGLLERDFATMRSLGEKYSGSVLKTTGDGLLLCFTSAVNAVAYAQQMQRDFAARARAENAEQVLTHRVGIHLGDVFLSNGDVMGDGVNIAARLQAQAEPGGICISQTVYDVVKNKLALEVVRLEPRGLKNIAEAITIYRVALDAGKPRLRPRAPAAPSVLRPVPTAAPAVRRLSAGQKLGILAGVLAAAGLAVFAILKAIDRNEERLAESGSTMAKVSHLLAQQPAAVPAKPAPPSADPAGPDFAALVRARAAGTPVSAGADADARAAADRLEPVLLDWVRAQLARYTADRPLLVQPLPGSPGRDIRAFTDATQRLYFAEGGAIRERPWSQLGAAESAAIIASLFAGDPAPPAAVRPAIAAYAYRHDVPELLDALPPAARP